MLLNVNSRHLLVAAFGRSPRWLFSDRPPVASGIEPQYVDPAIRAADSFTSAPTASGGRDHYPRRQTELNSYYVLHEDAQEKLRIIIEEAAASKKPRNDRAARSATSTAASWTRRGSKRSS
jgi:hypothetical protein